MSKVVLITGVSSGLGQAIAEYLHQRNYRVYGTSRRPERLQTPYTVLALDLNDPQSVEAAVGDLIQREGRIDILINNAGIGLVAPLEHTDMANVRQLFDTNVDGVIRICQAVFPHMRQAGGGRIVNISSIGAALGLPYRSLYCASKAALDVLTASLRMEMRPYGIQLCSIQAGDISTPIASHHLQQALPDGNVYQASYERVYANAKEEVEHGMPAAAVARQLEQLLRARRLRRVYRIGKPLQKLAVTAQRLLPDGWFDQIIMQFSKM